MREFVIILLNAPGVPYLIQKAKTEYEQQFDLLISDFKNLLYSSGLIPVSTGEKKPENASQINIKEESKRQLVSILWNLSHGKQENTPDFAKKTGQITGRPYKVCV